MRDVMTESRQAEPRDLTAGVLASSLADGATLLGRVGDEDVVLARSGDQLFAVGAHCTHYRGPLAEGLIVDRTVRCPWHHACFSLETGEALRAPALDPIACWLVEGTGALVTVREKAKPVAPRPLSRAQPSSILIVGGGAAGLAAADMLRRHGYDGRVAIVSADVDPPVDRPNLSKDYLAGEAQEDWIPLWPAHLYADRRVELLLGSAVTSIDARARTIRLDNGTQHEFGALLLATGAEPVRLAIPGGDGPTVRYLRSFADSRAIVERAQKAARVVVVGASFIGLEVAASLRARGLSVDVVAPEQQPLERVMGAELGQFVRSVHESHGVVFHLGQTVASISGRTLTLSGGATLDADPVVVGVGVRPAVALAERSGLTVDRGIVVNEFLETNLPGIFAAGDAARWPDPHTGDLIRIEHWVLAERQGQVAWLNMLGRRERFNSVPFFWSQHFDVTIRYVGHAETWDIIEVVGSLEGRDASVRFVRDGRMAAVATVGRDRACLEAELAFEQTENTAGR